MALNKRELFLKRRRAVAVPAGADAATIDQLAVIERAKQQLALLDSRRAF